jgi:hypothetical protein
MITRRQLFELLVVAPTAAVVAAELSAEPHYPTGWVTGEPRPIWWYERDGGHTVWQVDYARHAYSRRTYRKGRLVDSRWLTREWIEDATPEAAKLMLEEFFGP